MAGVLRPSKESPLVCYAIRKLNPEIFSHPVWLRFNTELSGCFSETNELLNIIAFAQPDDPLDTCQLLLLCAAWQSRVCQYEAALETIRRAHSLAKRAKLADAAIWADWGGAAVCFQNNQHPEAAQYLASLKEQLAGQGEWMLADFVEIVRQSLCVSEIKNRVLYPSTPLDSQSNDLLLCALDSLAHWGFVAYPATDRDSDTARVESQHSSLAVPPSNGYSKKFAHLFHKIFTALSSRNDFKFKRSWVSSAKLLPGEEHAHHDSIADETADNSQLFYERISQQAGQHDPESLTALMPRSVTKEETDNDRAGTGNSVIAEMLGSFALAIQDLPLKLPSSRGLSLLKYLILHHEHDTPRDVLMDIFWPEAGAEAARNNLNVAMHSLRQALRSITDLSIIRFEDGAYGLAKNLEIWLDVEEFEQRVKVGQRLEIRNQPASAVAEYEIAINLYRGDFLNDTPYENWTILDRERLRVSYLDTLDHLSQIYFNQESYAACINICDLILARDACREDVHCRMMQCYSRLGQAPLALRQYQACVSALQSELNVTPAPSTTRLYQKIRQHQRV